MVGNIFNKIKDIGNDIANGFSAMIDFTVNFPTILGDFLNYWFNPNFDGQFSIKEMLLQKFVFVDQFKGVLNNFNTAQPLNLHGSILGYEININGDVLEPYLPKLKLGISVLFYTCLLLACWRSISNTFGIGVGSAVGASVKGASDE